MEMANLMEGLTLAQIAQANESLTGAQEHFGPEAILKNVTRVRVNEYGPDTEGDGVYITDAAPVCYRDACPNGDDCSTSQEFADCPHGWCGERYWGFEEARKRRDAARATKGAA